MNRRTFLATLLTGASAFAIVGCAKAESETPMNPSKKILIAYYSWGGNTRALAKELAKQTGADTFEIEPVKPYSTSYSECVDAAKAEIQAKGRPELKALPDFSKYDTILIGSPNWWGTLAPPVSTFIENEALAGKQVALFETHGGGGLQNLERDFKAQTKGTVFGKTLVISGSRAARATTEAKNWLQAIGF